MAWLKAQKVEQMIIWTKLGNNISAIENITGRIFLIPLVTYSTKKQHLQILTEKFSLLWKVNNKSEK